MGLAETEYSVVRASSLELWGLKLKDFGRSPGRAPLHPVAFEEKGLPIEAMKKTPQEGTF